MLANSAVTFADFYAQRPLPSRRAHDFSGNDLLDQFRFGKTLQSGEGQTDGVVFPLFEFTQTRIDVAS